MFCIKHNFGMKKGRSIQKMDRIRPGKAPGRPAYTPCDMPTPTTPSSIPTTSSKMEQSSSQAAPAHVFDGPITRSRAKQLQQEVHALLCEIPFINENYIFPKSCMLLLLRFTKEDDKDTPRLNQRGELRRTSSAWQNCHEETVISLDS